MIPKTCFVIGVACAEDQVEESRQFMCVDLTYICALLQDGFGFNKDTRLEVGLHCYPRDVLSKGDPEILPT